MAWILLVIAGIFEMAMAISLKESHGFTRLWPSLLFAVTGTISFVLLSWVLRTLPVGTSHAVSTGIGAAGTTIIGILFLAEPRAARRLVSIALIGAGVVGLQIAGGGH